MSEKTFNVPSLSTTRTWQFTLGGSKDRWDKVFSAWRADDLLNLGYKTPRPLTRGEDVVLDEFVGDLRIWLARSVDHSGARGTTQLDFRARWDAWLDVRPRGSKTLTVGVFSDAKQRDWLLLRIGGTSLDPSDSIPILHPVGLAPLAINYGSAWTADPVAFFHLLEAESPPTWPWLVLSRTLSKAGQTPDSLRDVNHPNVAFDALNLALSETRGTSFAAHAFNGLVPSFESVDADFDPLQLIALEDQSLNGTRAWSTRLLQLQLGADAHGKALFANVDWFYSFRDRLDTIPSVGAQDILDGSGSATGFRLRGALDRALDPRYFSQRWGFDGKSLTQTFSSMLDSVASDGTVVAFRMINCRPTGEAAWVRLGSVEFQPIDPEPGDACTLDFTLRGSISSVSTAVYPDTRLANLRCKVRYAAGPDPVAETASLDALDAESERLRRETDPIVTLREQPTRIGLLTMRTRYEGGRDATTEIRIALRNDAHATAGSALWLNLRPFGAALVNLGDETNARSEMVWRSDDPSGAQWRVEHDTVQVTLPPQAVGEEMERGDRFYTVLDTPTIRADRPVRFRFSRPTYLTLRPSDASQRRRFEVSPLNLSELVRGSFVDRMVVEMAYPLEATYERAVDSTRTLQLKEAAEFFGRPAPAVATSDWDLSSGTDQPGQLSRYVGTLDAAGQSVYTRQVLSLVERQRTVQRNFASRLAELHVRDPLRARSDLKLSEDVRFRLRDTRQGAAPLASPLPRDAVFDPAGEPTGGGFSKFLKDNAWSADSIRAGLIHSFEMASELVEVLDTPQAVSGVIDALTLSALGATGNMEAAFASGKTSFAVVVSHGQLSRLVKTRIGRIGALWNRAKHVVVYERSAARSAQFADEQAATDAFDGWPMLRKTEEYVEPIQVERRFAEERGKKEGSTGFIDAAVFATRRIYVNGAWARDLSDGYELPLWDRRASEINPRFYPRPQIFVICRGEADRMTRLWFRDPDRLYFYSSSAKGTDADTDAWRPVAGIDFDRLPRWPVLERSTTRSLAQRIPADASLCTAPRFDLAVDAEGPVDLQYGRGTTPMLVSLQRVSIGRMAQATPDATLLDKPAYMAVSQAASAAQSAQIGAANLVPSLDALKSDLLDRLGKEIHAGRPCADISDQLRAKVSDAAAILKRSLNPVPDALNALYAMVAREPELWEASARQWTDSLFSRAALPADVLEGRLRQLISDLSALRRALPTSGNLEGDLKKRRDGCVANVMGMATDAQQRVEEQLTAAVAQAVSVLSGAGAAVDAAVAALADAGQSAKAACAMAHAQLVRAATAVDKLPPQARSLADPVSNWLRLLAKQVDALQNTLDFVAGLAPALVGRIRDELTALTRAVGVLRSALATWIDQTIRVAAATAVSALKTLNDALGVAAAGLRQSEAVDAVSVAIMELTRQLDHAMAGATGYRAALSHFQSDLVDAAKAARVVFTSNANNVLKTVSDRATSLLSTVASTSDELQNTLFDLIQTMQGDCEALQRAVEKKLDEAAQWAEEQARAAIGDVMSAETTRRIEACAAAVKDVVDVGDSALSLARAVGELPSVTPLKFDIDVAAYVFDGVKPQIQMSPAIARLEQAGDKLLESLGVSVPCSSLLDQLVPDSLKGYDFSAIFNKYAGIDFNGLFRNFKLGDLGSDEVKVTHGFDKASRRAWVNASVGFAHPEYEELFAFGPVSLGLDKMVFDAYTGVETSIVNNVPQAPVAKTRAKLLADWTLQGAGQMLVRFKEVAITYDGASGFDFAVSPDNIELNPALKFVTEFVDQFKGKLPPAIQIIEEGGRPVGVSAGTTVVLDDLPDLGAVTIGPIDMRSSLTLRLDGGRFTIGSAFSLGNKQTPIFVQISWLGGGCWLEARADYVDGVVKPAISVGLSVGSTKSFDFAGVAKGSYNVQLYCYIEITERGDSVALGLSIMGSALIIGFVNANVSLLLEAKHSGGSMEGTGRLDVEVKISWFYTFRFKQSVKHSF